MDNAHVHKVAVLLHLARSNYLIRGAHILWANSMALLCHRPTSSVFSETCFHELQASQECQHTLHQAIPQAMYQSINQSINQSMHQSINRQAMHQSINGPAQNCHEFLLSMTQMRFICLALLFS
jgi:hypothetical protein